MPDNTYPLDDHLPDGDPGDEAPSDADLALEYGIDPPRRNPPRRRPPRVVTLYEDPDLHALDKPVGLSSVSERWDPDALTAIDLLWYDWQRGDAQALRPHVVHRLDKETSGVLLFARHRDAQAHVRAQFRERTVAKSYLALVVGRPSASEGVIEITVEEDPRRPGRMRVVQRGGKECVTEYSVVEEFRDFTLLRLHPRQGRTHQIRISLQAIGNPCAADKFYGDGAPILLSRIKRRYRASQRDTERPLLGRLGLHAERLELLGRNGDAILIEAPLPKDFGATLKQLRRWGN